MKSFFYLYKNDLFIDFLFVLNLLSLLYFLMKLRTINRKIRDLTNESGLYPIAIRNQIQEFRSERAEVYLLIFTNFCSLLFLYLLKQIS